MHVLIAFHYHSKHASLHNTLWVPYKAITSSYTLSYFILGITRGRSSHEVVEHQSLY